MVLPYDHLDLDLSSTHANQFTPRQLILEIDLDLYLDLMMHISILVERILNCWDTSTAVCQIHVGAKAPEALFWVDTHDCASYVIHNRPQSTRARGR